MTDIDKLIRDLRQPGGDDARDRPRPSDRDPRFGRATPRVDGPDPLAGRHEETVMTPRQQAIEAMAEASHEAFRQMCAEWEAPLKWSDVEEEVREETRQNSAAQLDSLLAELPGRGLQIELYNAVAQAAQEPPAWVPVADVPEAWKDGRELIARFHGDNPYPCVIVEYTQSSGTWCGDNGDVVVSHLCDCIPRSGP